MFFTVKDYIFLPVKNGHNGEFLSEYQELHCMGNFVEE